MKTIGNGQLYDFMYQFMKATYVKQTPQYLSGTAKKHPEQTAFGGAKRS
ncbi:hypothetical protein G8C92_16760 [Paenibacillus donghaensis]|nr:hypothetical protein [Paenibacillus donghaensis]MBE9915667.1 hypothetical protein [Paenibacillus donghaensis]